ncbi:tektin-3 [Eurytemora carolleeae]|uniref:tektin-3 n=1 Tax=Eurytemora carolleeae TaxID=1294199 RepID=UPI000C7734F8|nr:tektin-3 [Eurytemora carolleeae]|eukprot:XP_023336708.1 tektin-3-like [Eurytemora affinis]
MGVRKYLPAGRRGRKVLPRPLVEGGCGQVAERGGAKDRKRVDRIPHSQWRKENHEMYRSASLARTLSERLRGESGWLITEVDRAARRAQQDTNYRLEEKLKESITWRGELQDELDFLTGEVDQLKDSENQLVASLKQTNRPLKVTTSCLLAREGRRGADRVRDGVEVCLEKELDTIREQQKLIRDLIKQAAVCTSNLKKAQATLEGDLSNKDAALDIDHNCHNLHGNSSGLELHGRIEHGGGEGDTVSWADRTRKNIIFSQKSRSASERLRAEAERVLTAAANSMVKAWNKTNQAFSVRISECSDTHAKLQGHLSLTLQELYDLDKHIRMLHNAIKAKSSPLRLAQSRLELRTHRPEKEATKDNPQISLVNEVYELQSQLARLNTKLDDAEVAKIIKFDQ